MANIHAELAAVTSVTGGSSALRSRLLTAESAADGAAALRVAITTIESVAGGSPAMRARINLIEASVGYVDHPPRLRTEGLFVETLMAVLEPFMSNLVFPKLIGLAFDVNKTPVFSTKLAEHTGGGETATSFFQNPKWEFKLTYDYLPDLPKQVGDTDLHQIMGLFLQMRGRGDTFLFQDPDDYSVTSGFQFACDGVTAQMKLLRGIGGFYEPIGQLDQSVVTLAVQEGTTQNSTVPATGPYTVTVTHAAAYYSTDSVTIGGVAATVGTGPGQYTVAAGVYTFNAADHGKAVAITYRYTVAPANYSVTMPNVLTFTSAPPSGDTIYATFNYYFVCRFLQDSTDFTKFMEQLWNVQEISFRSIPQ